MTKRQTRPTEAQSRWLRRIAHQPMMITYIPGEEPRYHLADGLVVPAATANLLIRKGWVVGQRDGLFEQPQSYRVKTP
jgi:hypothetical protein